MPLRSGERDRLVHQLENYTLVIEMRERAREPPPAFDEELLAARTNNPLLLVLARMQIDDDGKAPLSDPADLSHKGCHVGIPRGPGSERPFHRNRQPDMGEARIPYE